MRIQTIKLFFSFLFFLGFFGLCFGQAPSIEPDELTTGRDNNGIIVEGDNNGFVNQISTQSPHEIDEPSFWENLALLQSIMIGFLTILGVVGGFFGIRTFSDLKKKKKLKQTWLEVKFWIEDHIAILLIGGLTLLVVAGIPAALSLTTKNHPLPPTEIVSESPGTVIHQTIEQHYDKIDPRDQERWMEKMPLDEGLEESLASIADWYDRREIDADLKEGLEGEVTRFFENLEKYAPQVAKSGFEGNYSGIDNLPTALFYPRVNLVTVVKIECQISRHKNQIT